MMALLAGPEQVSTVGQNELQRQLGLVRASEKTVDRIPRIEQQSARITLEVYRWQGGELFQNERQLC
jgi:hypothetical protein